MAAKALVLSLGSVLCHGNNMNAHASDGTFIFTFDSQAHLIQVHKYCTKWETFDLPYRPGIYLPRMKGEPDLSLGRDKFSVRYEC